MRFVLDSRNISQDDVLIKISMDGGGGFFKVFLQMIDKNKNHKAQKQRISVNDFQSQSSSV